MFASHSCCVLFVLGMILTCARAAGSGSACHQSGAHGKWYDHEFQYNYVEALILICLIVIAIIFEQVWHRVEHEAMHSYRYGRLGMAEARGHAAHGARESSGKIKHECLTMQYVHRCGGEFMTLGVLAFCVFIFNNAKGFEAMENLYKDHAVPLPRSANDWLHMVELVHMKLFVGMVLYFGLIGSTVRICDKKFKKWESCRLHQVEDLARGKSPQELEIDHQADSTLGQYDLWQKYFFAKIALWKDERENLYKALLEKMDIDPEEDDADVKLRTALVENFSFAQYLALNISEGMCDTIHVHPLSWACLLTLFVGFIFMHRFAEVDLFLLSWVFIGATVLLLIIMFALVRGEARRIKKFVDDHSEATRMRPASNSERRRSSLAGHTDREEVNKITAQDRGRSINERFKTEDWAIRGLQVVLFLVAYVFARTLMDFHDWEENPQDAAMICISFALLFIVLMKSLQGLPTFLALTALPPYCDAGNVAYMFAVMEDCATVSDAPSRGPSRKLSQFQNPFPSWSPPRTPLRQENEKLDASLEDMVKTMATQIEELSTRMDRADNAVSSHLVASGGEQPQADLDAVWKHLTMLESQIKKDRLPAKMAV